MINDRTRRKHLLVAQMMLERAELAAELDNVRRAAAPPQLARGLFGSVLGGTAGGGLAATLFTSLLGRFGTRRRAAAAPGAVPRAAASGAWIGALLRPYPLLASVAAGLWPLLANRRALKTLAIGGAVGAAVWQLMRLRRSD